MCFLKCFFLLNNFIFKDSDVTEIKKKYRELSKTHHPDKGFLN